MRQFSVNPLAPLDTLLEPSEGELLPLPSSLATLYGRLRLGGLGSAPYVYANFASTLDGVVSLNPKGRSGGGEITGFNPHDRMVMGILRSVADAVIVGAGTLRSVPHHLWTAGHIYPNLASSFGELRRSLGRSGEPLNVVVSARGDLDLSLPVFSSGEVKALVVTTEDGARRLGGQRLPDSVSVHQADGNNHLRASSVLTAVKQAGRADRVLLEGGPTLMGEFLSEKLLDELFLTVASQIAGRASPAERPGLVSGRTFAPEVPLWSSLAGVKRAADLLFLRYRFRPGGPPGPTRPAPISP
ncbi:MAG: dihydrofolate reductase family protein [Thermoplasmata archaeon]|nr:dihydrofolate reductase family protein [Thermoplasmata archaeon]